MNIEQSCENCKHFRKPDEQAVGMCICEPPTPYPIIEREQGVVGSRAGYKVAMVLSFHPPVKADDCCGKFEYIIGE